MGNSLWVRGRRGSTTGDDLTTSHSGVQCSVGQVAGGLEKCTQRRSALRDRHSRRGGRALVVLSIGLQGHLGNSTLSSSRWRGPGEAALKESCSLLLS